MIKDRGNIKWTSLMLTEHREKLEELFEHENDIEKPILDEQQLERLDILIREAVRDQFSVKVLYYKSRRLHESKGKIIVKDNFLYLNEKKLIKDNIIDIVIV